MDIELCINIIQNRSMITLIEPPMKNPMNEDHVVSYTGVHNAEAEKNPPYIRSRNIKIKIGGVGCLEIKNITTVAIAAVCQQSPSL